MALAFASGIWAVQSGVQAGGDGSTESLRTVLEVVSLVKTQYVDNVDAIDLIGNYVQEGTINGMLRASLDDPYTRYMDVDAFSQMQIDTTGEYGGIGIMVGIQNDKLTIIAPFEDTPGHRAGLRPGDEIVAIDGRSTEHMSLDEAVSLMRGPEGEGLTLGISRQGGEPFFVHIVRSIVQVPSVSRAEIFAPGTFEGQSSSIGYVRLQRFSERTEPELRDTLETFEAAQVGGRIIDLRDNPGGTLAAAIDVANMFLEDGAIMHIVGRNDNRRTVYAFENGTFPYRPTVVLVNNFSASASEIVSGALQDRNYAPLVGATTFGKGLVQTVIPLRDGSALSLTSARYQTAGGRYIDGDGIPPDIAVDLSDDDDELISPLFGVELADDPQFLRAVEVLMSEIAEWGHLTGLSQSQVQAARIQAESAILLPTGTDAMP